MFQPRAEAAGPAKPGPRTLSKKQKLAIAALGSAVLAREACSQPAHRFAHPQAVSLRGSAAAPSDSAASESKEYLAQTQAEALPREPSTSTAAVATAAAGLALAAAGATTRSARRAAAAAKGGRKGGVTACRSDGSVEGVRILGGWSSGTPMSESGKIHQALSTLELQVIGEGVAQLAFLVDKEYASSFVEEFELDKGTTENSYILFDPEDGLDGTAPLLLVDVPERRFSDAFVEKLAPYMKRIRGLVVTSVDEENAPVMETLALEHEKAGGAEKLQVYCSAPGEKILKNMIKDKAALEQMKIQGIDDDSYIELPCKNPPTDGEVPHLDVVDTANPKIPEGMAVFDERNGMLYSGKFFSAHVKKTDTDGKWEDFAEDWHHFFDCYFFTASAQEAIRRIFQIAADNSEDQLGLYSADVTSLAPRHGPILKREAWKLMAKYEAWLERKLSTTSEGSALVLFASAYGNTTTMAKAVERGIAATGVKTRMLNCEFCTAEDIKTAYEQCEALAIGSPTLGGHMPIQMKEALGVILNAAQQGNQESTSVRSGSFTSSRVPAGVFGSFGWSGEAVDELYIRLKDTGFEFAFDPIRCKFKPTDKVIGECEAAGTRLAQRMNDVRREREEAIDEKMSAKLEKTTETEDGVVKAFGQIINASCVLTLKQEEGQPEIRMPVSWVSQASFTPLGLMLAVEKESLDSFMQLPLEEQLTILFNKYDADDSGELDREEADNLFDELFGATPGSASGEMLRGVKDDAWKLLDADGGGTVDVDEFRAAAASGPLAELIARQRKVASLEASLSGSMGSGPVEFTLSMLPEGMSSSEAMEAELEPKKKPKNGCPAIKGATSYVECKLQGLMNAGKGSVLYAAVLAGEVLDKQANTDLLRADRVAAEAPADAATPDAVAADASADAALPATEVEPREASVLEMAALAGGRRLPAHACTQTALAGGSAAPAARASRMPRRGVDLKGPEVLSEPTTWTGLTPGKEYKLQTLCREVAENTRTIRSLDGERDRFDIEFALTHGTTYNAYTIKGETHTALIDASHKKFEAQFFDVLESPDGGAIDLATLDYIVVSHTEPDHSGLIENILVKAQERGNDKITVVGTKVCIQFLQNLIHMDFKTKIVKGGDQIDLGGGHVLDFVVAPNLHWPDTMFTYDNKTQLLYTCDAFGMHYCSENVTDVESIADLEPHYKLYYNCLMRPNARSVNSALKKMGDLPGSVSAIATGHGPMLVQNMDEWIAKYKGWSEEATKKMGPSVCMFWVSRHGESERLAQAMAYGLTNQDVLVEMHDLNAIDAFEVVEACMRNQVIVIFSPPVGEGTAQTNVGSIITSCNPKDHKLVICASGGEKDEPVDSLVGRCVQQTGIPKALPPLRIQAGSEEKTLAFYEDSGRQLAKEMLSKKKQAAKDKLDQKTTEALGKMGSGRYIVTGLKGEISSAAVATWVMPASSEPPSVAVAIAKDHQLQSLTQIGDHFVVNMLEEGNYLDLMKHFQKDILPGEDIFDGVETTQVQAGDVTGIAVTGCSAYLTCTVYSRMDAGDHILICGEALQGQVVRDAPTAANYRKSAAYY